MAIQLRDLTMSSLDTLNDALAQASSDAADGNDDSVLWTIVYDLEDAVDFVERALKSIPSED